MIEVVFILLTVAFSYLSGAAIQQWSHETTAKNKRAMQKVARFLQAMTCLFAALTYIA